MADILEIGLPDGQTRLDLPVEQVLEACRDKLQEVTIIGRTHDGEFYMSSSIGDCYHTYYWLDHAKQFLRDSE